MATPAATLADRLREFEAKQGPTIPTRDVVDIVSNLVGAVRADLDVAGVQIGQELRDLLDFIHGARTEIAAIKPHALSTRDIPGAADELDAIVQHTEAAAGTIMDCAEDVSAIAASVEGALAEQLQAIATRIFEASSFQDITGQRVTKVVRVLKQIEERLGRLAVAVGDTHTATDTPTETDADGVPVDHKKLLNGPQLPVNANNQDDIDALLASFD
jgi:chemotaxis protein CheZ